MWGGFRGCSVTLDSDCPAPTYRIVRVLVEIFTGRRVRESVDQTRPGTSSGPSSVSGRGDSS